MVAANLYGRIDVVGRLVFAPAPIVSNSPSGSAAKTDTKRTAPKEWRRRSRIKEGKIKDDTEENREGQMPISGTEGKW